MSYVQIPDTIHLDSRFLRVSEPARLAYLTSWLHASNARSDGFVAVAALAMVAATEAIAGELEQSGLWAAVPGGWTVAGYLPLNRTRAEIEALSRKRSEAGQKGGRRNAARWGEALAQSSVSPSVSPSVSSNSADADAADPLPFPEGKLGKTAPATAAALAEALASPESVARLAALGVDDPAGLLAAHGDELVAAWLDELPNRPALTNPAGFLVGRLRAGELPPAREPAAESALARIARENAAAKLATLPPLQAVGE
ncbi:MAG: hypothetical protein IT295_10280 [Dehalococcoidia bacterium]|nr:hypothetical protein [Dehalococcoidia bacterium]